MDNAEKFETDWENIELYRNILEANTDADMKKVVKIYEEYAKAGKIKKM
tara:strand:- start:593 stop:739 length:147 start_codon:yes stop_codon:yes gene_type:complete